MEIVSIQYVYCQYLFLFSSKKENNQLKSYIKFLQNKLHSVAGSDENNDLEAITPVEDEDADASEGDDTFESNKYKDFD